MSASRCPGCSAAVPAGARFCSECGAALEISSAAQPTKTAAAPSPDPPSEHGRFLPGALLGERYRIVGLLGRGGMGEVYRADDLELGQSVALKFVPEKLAADPAAWHRLRSEVRTARQLAHPNICRVYDIANADGHVFFSMEYVDGDDLSHVLRRLGPPSKDKAIELARQLCAGLAAAHENDVLHRDLKPANVMIDGRGRVRITDFGLAGLVDELEANPQRAGTPAYMAPEQRASGTVSKRSDIYSLGLVLYELFTGKRPFDESTQASATSAPSMQSHNESVDPAVERVVQRCLETDPAERPASAYEVMTALPGGDPVAAALAAGETPSPEMLADVQARGGLAPRHGLLLFAATLLSLFVLAIVGPRWTWMPLKGPDELAARVREAVHRLGHDLPPQHVSSLLGNDGIDLAAVDGEGSWPPTYLYWYRASPGSLQPLNLHIPVPRPSDPAARPPGDLEVVLGSSGRLLEFDVVPQPHDPTTTTPFGSIDWRPLLELAGLDPDELETVPLVHDVPPYCDEAVAFRVARPDESEGEYVLQAAAHRGEVVWATTFLQGEENGFLERTRLKELVVFGGASHGNLFLPGWFFALIILAPAFLAWNNMRRGRADRHGAVVFGAVVFVAYFLYDSLHAPTAFGNGMLVQWMLNLNPAAHASLHGLNAALIYVAVEPYVRRAWPKALIGWARLARGRWRDPVVGREILFGTAVTFAVYAIALVARTAIHGLAGMPTHGLLPHTDRARDSGAMLAELPHMLAVAMFLTMMLYFVLLLLRWITRRDWIASLGTAFLFHPLFAAIAGVESGDGVSAVVTMIPVLAGLVTMLVLAMRVGLIAASIASIVVLMVPSIPATFDPSKFYAPSGFVGMLAFAALAAFGLRTSLGTKLGDLLD